MGNMPTNHVVRSNIGISFTPDQHYKLDEDRKYDIYSLWPTFHFKWLQAYSLKNKLSSSYSRFSLGIEYHVKINETNHIDYYVKGGIFTGARRMFYPYYQYFYSHQIFLTSFQTTTAFNINSYRFSTHK